MPLLRFFGRFSFQGIGRRTWKSSKGVQSGFHCSLCSSMSTLYLRWQSATTELHVCCPRLQHTFHAMHTRDLTWMTSAMSQEGTVVDAEEIDNDGTGFLRVFFGPPSESSSHSGTLDSTATDSEARADDLGLSLTWRVPVTTLQAAGFTCTGKAILSDGD